MAKKRNQNAADGNILFGASEINQVAAKRSSSRTVNQSETPPKERGFWAGLGAGERVAAIAVCLLMVVGALGASGFGERVFSTFRSQKTNQSKITGQTATNSSMLSMLNPFPTPSPAAAAVPPQLSKEYIYAGSRLLAVEDALASAVPSPTPTPPPGYEADIGSRPNGDGNIYVNDIQLIRLFSVGSGLPYQSNEFQRADCSPRGTSGDGFIDADDIQQARRYSAGLDAYQPAGGPISLLSLDDSNQPSKPSYSFAAWKQYFGFGSTQSTVVRVQNTSGNAGEQISVPITVDMTGNEADFSFSMNYDSSKLSNPVVTIGTAGGDVITNLTATNPNADPIGFSIATLDGGMFTAGANQLLVTIRFDVAANASAGTTDLTFTDAPSKKKVTGIDPRSPLPEATFSNGVVTILRHTVDGY